MSTGIKIVNSIPSVIYIGFLILTSNIHIQIKGG